MENTILVKELIEKLQKVDQNLPMCVSGVGITKDDSWNAPLEFKDDTVDVYNGICRINISSIG